jgi:hypothetical protein
MMTNPRSTIGEAVARLEKQGRRRLHISKGAMISHEAVENEQGPMPYLDATLYAPKESKTGCALAGVWRMKRTLSLSPVDDGDPGLVSNITFMLTINLRRQFL